MLHPRCPAKPPDHLLEMPADRRDTTTQEIFQDHGVYSAPFNAMSSGSPTSPIAVSHTVYEFLRLNFLSPGGKPSATVEFALRTCGDSV